MSERDDEVSAFADVASADGARCADDTDIYVPESDMCTYAVDELAALLPFPDPTANKYSRGKLTAIVGSVRYPGAACLAARASQRMGAGYTEVVTAQESVDLVRVTSPSLVVSSWQNPMSDALASPRPNKPCACLVGSGFDAGDDDQVRLVHRVLKQASMPVVVDGGGLDALSSKKGRRLLRRRFVNGLPTVITPHGGEATRLAAPLNLTTDDPAKLARLIALAYGVVAMVKGPDTFVSDGERTVSMTEGTAALAKAGTGDVLAGMIGALLAQGIDAVDACVLAATIHARAGVVAAERQTAICVTAEDVIDAISAVIGKLVSS